MTPLDVKPYIAWLDGRFAEARALRSDTLLIVIAGTVFVALLFLRAWWKSARQARALKRTMTALEAELQTSRMVLEDEIRWRRAAEKIGAQVPKPETGPLSAPRA